MAFIAIIFRDIILIWVGIYAVLFLYIIIKNYIPYKTKFDEEYYTIIPEEINIFELNYLMGQRINGNDLTAEVLSLLNKGFLKMDLNERNIEVLTRGENHAPMTLSEEATIKLVIDVFGDATEVTLDEISDFTKKPKNRDILLMEYNIWAKIVRKENFRHIFYEIKEGYGAVKFISTTFLAPLRLSPSK